MEVLNRDKEEVKEESEDLIEPSENEDEEQTEEGSLLRQGIVFTSSDEYNEFMEVLNKDKEEIMERSEPERNEEVEDNNDEEEANESDLDIGAPTNEDDPENHRDELLEPEGETEESVDCQDPTIGDVPCRELIPTNIQASNHKCEVCGETFDHIHKLNKHKDRKHYEPCTMCEEPFYIYTEKIIHINQYHPNNTMEDRIPDLDGENESISEEAWNCECNGHGEIALDNTEARMDTVENSVDLAPAKSITHSPREVQGKMDEVEQIVDDNEEENSALAPVDASTVKDLTAREKRKRELIVDEVKAISGEEMKAQLSDTGDIVTTLDLALPTKRLMHWKEMGQVEKLFALPGRTLQARHIVKDYQNNLTARPCAVETIDTLIGDSPEEEQLPSENVRRTPGSEFQTPVIPPKQIRKREPEFKKESIKGLEDGKQGGKLNTNPRQLSRHLKTHTGEQSDKCQFCEKSFSNNANLQRHIRSTHQDEKPYDCPYCGESTQTEINLRGHIKRNHKDERKCEYCDKRFINIGNVRRHIRMVHDGERNYQCSQCERKFQQRSSLKMHTRTHEKHRKKHTKATRNSENDISTDSHPSDQDLFSCRQCNIDPLPPRGIRIHLIEEHFRDRLLSCYSTGNDGNTCDICYNTFRNTNELALHIGLEHVPQL